MSANNNIWTRSVVSNLIHIYKKYECLWQIDSPNYKNKNKRLEAWHSLCNEVNSRLKLQLSTEDIQKKISGLRTSYSKEVKLVEGSRHSGAGDNDGVPVYEPTWWAFHSLSFLNKYVRPLTYGHSNINIKQVNTKCKSI